MLSVSLLMTLSGCGLFGRTEQVRTLPPLPNDLKVCFEELASAPKPGSLSKAQVIDLIASLKRSELEKSLCGKRLIAFYEGFI